MERTNIALETQKRITELSERKAQEMLRIQLDLKKAKEEQGAAIKAMKTATAEIDLDAYQIAKIHKEAAEDAIAMYTARQDQLQQKDMVTEEESDHVIDSLLEYEEDLRSDFETSCGKLLDQLRDLYDDYTDHVEEAEKAIKDWTTMIHTNHRMLSTGNNARRDYAVPVRYVRYEGGSLASALDHLFRAIGE